MKETHLYISDKKQEVIVIQDGLKFETQYLYITRNRKRIVDFYDLRNLKNTKDLVVWFIQNEKFKKLELPKNVLKAIENYIVLQSKGLNTELDCFAFCCLAYGLQIPKRADLDGTGYRRIEHDADQWQKENSKWLTPGDVFFMYGSVVEQDKERVIFKHAAIYVGEGLYVSVYGWMGELSFSTMSDMERDFKVDTIIKVKPRDKK